MALEGPFTVRVEDWTVKNTGKSKNPKIDGDQKVVTKIAVRGHGGKFHGATNFRQKVRGA